METIAGVCLGQPGGRHREGPSQWSSELLEPLLKSAQVASDSQAFQLGGELQGLGRMMATFVV